MPIHPTRDPQQLLEQLRSFPVHMGAEEGRPEQEHLDACLLLGAGDLELVAAHPFPAAAALLRSMPRRGPLLGEDGMARGRREAWRQLYAALREAFPPAPEAVRCLDKLGPLEANALHILAMREGGEPVAVRTEALAQLSKLELVRVDVDGRPFPLELTPLGLEVWALRQESRAPARSHLVPCTGPGDGCPLCRMMANARRQHEAALRSKAEQQTETAMRSSTQGPEK